MGFAFSMRERAKREQKERALLKVHSDVVEKLSSVHAQVPPPKVQTMLEGAHERAATLVSQMEARKAYWEGEIVKATEELRQTNIVLEGGRQLLATITAGMPQRVDATPGFREVTDDELANLLQAGFEADLRPED